ncbi:hypothetical protein L2E82_12976 [Cichorium intybus]|uniref:Uncharacterized protein n=1 Tax=Cichorium intybus TaxID=13427 RepID=A0ACB9GHH1_CICIN|nr:hypothetical protein L2E82_12976 [Cichorium intybus]
MEITAFSTPARILIPSANRPTSHWPKNHSFQPKLKRAAVVSLLTPSNSTNSLKTESSYNITTPTTNTVYKDNWFDRVAINYLSKAVQDTVGTRNEKSGYESLVVAAGAVFRNFDPIQQRQLVVKALQNATPGPIAYMASSFSLYIVVLMRFSITPITLRIYDQNIVATFEVFEGVFCGLHHHLLPLACRSM